VWHADPKLFIALFGITLATATIPTINILISSQLIDTIVKATSSTELTCPTFNDTIILIILIGIINITGQILERLASVVQILQQTRVTNYVRLLVSEKASSLDLAFFESKDFHDMMQNVSNEAMYRPLVIVQELISLIAMTVTIISLITILILWQIWIIPVIIFSSLATLWTSTYFATAYVNLVTTRADIERQSHYFQWELTNEGRVSETRLFRLHILFLERLRLLLDKLYKQDRELIYRKTRYSSLIEIALSMIQPFLIGFAAIQTLERIISLGQFSLYTQTVISLSGYLQNLMISIGQLHESNLFVLNLFNFLAIQPEVEAPRLNSKEYVARISSIPRIEFRNVSFCYPGTDRMVIRQVSFAINPGDVVALVGENGAGKTTIVKLIAGLYELTEGQILFDDVDIRMLDRSDLRAYLSVIFQDFGIYHLSLYDNIGIGKVEQLDDRTLIKEVSQKTGLASIVEELPNKYDTVIGRFFDQGHELSGGQRQLVALTRAVMRSAPVLILDEPAAALDVYTEQNFFHQLLDVHASHQQSVLLISHRFTSVRRANNIVVLHRGEIVEQGCHDELLALNGRYADMFTSQLKMYDSPNLYNREKTLNT
jgi:ATP-binding cassette subfamily B protein